MRSLIQPVKKSFLEHIKASILREDYFEPQNVTRDSPGLLEDADVRVIHGSLVLMPFRFPRIGAQSSLALWRDPFPRSASQDGNAVPELEN